MDLKQLIDEKKTRLSAWMEFQDVNFLIEYAEKGEMQKMLERSKKKRWEKHQPVEDFDDDKFAAQLSQKIRDWDLTIGKLADLINIDIGDMDPETAVECTDENRAVLVKETYGLANWLREQLSDVTAYREQTQAVQEKNSEAGPGKSSSSAGTRAKNAAKPGKTG
ncbi:MAG: hypothetical protein U5L07_07735 [Desulfobacterales bacterium]|nr:hypothetical protein [Desulfobacterales bacterium]